MELLPYVEEGMSLYDCCREDRKRMLEIIAARYMGENPPVPFQFREYDTNGFPCGNDGRFVIDLNEKISDCPSGWFSVVKSRFYKEQEEAHVFSLECFSPVTVILNEKKVFQSNAGDECRRNGACVLELPCKKGWNEIALVCRKTKGGFGCLFGVKDPGWAWISFYNPLPGYRKRLGFAYTRALKSVSGSETLNVGESEWILPDTWSGEEQKLTAAERLWKRKANTGNGYGYGWRTTKLRENGRLRLAGEAVSPLAIWVDGKLFAEYRAGTHFQEMIPVPAGIHHVVFRTEIGANGGYGWRLAGECGDSQWLYLGPLSAPCKEVEVSPGFYGLFGDEKRYWQSDEPGIVIRPVLENRAFGRWNYPLGVTLYGLTRLSAVCPSEAVSRYVEEHMQECLRLYEYSIWDRAHYGYPEINNQLTAMRSLDDCGSFGSAMLEKMAAIDDRNVEEVADRIAHYMEHIQERREDGAFYRLGPAGYPDATLWADDLYMSVPFLCRYYKRSGKKEYLDDAVNQFRQFRKYLYQPEKRIFSHVYDFKFASDTGVAWGRGNGWCFFSLTELLEVLPESHDGREFLLSFYQELAEGFMELQVENGMWHQVLTEEDTYEETSCTAMFVYGLCRGRRFGWLEEEQWSRAAVAAERGWHGIISRAVDRKGNVYGICRGSFYSFTSNYYRNELLWSINDPHGIGIVLLAGVEMELMEKECTQAQ